jgi:RsiW-degrading membrane proteinase PrsW (M82 family)
MKITLPWPEAIRHLILLTIGWFLLCVMIGLFQTFDFLEASKGSNQTKAIVAGLKVSGLIFFIGSVAVGSTVAIFLRDKKRER